MTDKPTSPFSRLDTNLLRSTQRPAEHTPAAPTRPQATKSTKPHVGKATSGEVDKPTTPQVGKPTSREDGKSTSGEVEKTTTLQGDKSTKPLVEKYTTHLRPGTIKMVKRRALDEDRKDYEIVQAALDAHLKQ